MKTNSLLRTAFAVAVVLATTTSQAHAMFAAPEIDPSLVVSGLGLMGGIALIVRGRRK